MSILTPIPPETPFLQRAFYAIPVIGWIARDVMFGSRDNQLWLAVIIASAWLMSVGVWGLTALLIPFTLAIPAAFIGAFNALVWRHERKAARAPEADAVQAPANENTAPRRAA